MKTIWQGEHQLLRIQSAALYFVLPLLLLTIWHTVVSLGWVHDYTMPSPAKVFSAAGTLLTNGTLFEHTLASVNACWKDLFWHLYLLSQRGLRRACCRNLKN